MAHATTAGRADAARGIMSTTYRPLTLGVLALVALGAFEALAVATVMPRVASTLHGLGWYAVGFGIPVATATIGMVLAGGWADTEGPRRPVAAGTAAFAAGLLVAGLAVSMPMLALGRAIQGLGTGCLGVALAVLVARCYPPGLHPRMFAAFAAAWVLPSIVGPVLATLIATQLGWRWIFLAVSLLAPLTAVPVLRRLGPRSGEPPAPTSSPRERAQRVRWAVAAAAGATWVQVRPPGAGSAALVGAAGLAWLLLAGRRLLPAGTLRGEPGLPALVTARGAAAAAFALAQLFLPLLLVHHRGLSTGEAGLAFTAGSVAWFLGSWMQGRVADPDHRSWLARAGMLSLAAGASVSAVAVLLEAPTATLFVAWASAGLGMGAVVPILTVAAIEQAPSGEEGAHSAALQLSDSLFTTTALAVGGWLFASLFQISATAMYVAAYTLAAAVAAVGAFMVGRARQPLADVGSAGPRVASGPSHPSLPLTTACGCASGMHTSATRGGPPAGNPDEETP